MTASSRGSRAMISLIRSSRHPRVCSDCVQSITRCAALSQRSYSAAAASLSTIDNTLNNEHPPIQPIPPVTASATTPEYIVKSGVVLSRPPLLTRTQTAFEKAFFLYQKRLNERLAMPFSRYFYFKKDTPADHDWKVKAKERKGIAARDVGDYQAYGDFAWNDEALVGEDNIADPKEIRDVLVRDVPMRPIEGQREADMVEGIKVDKPLERWTEADTKMDMRRLDRKLSRTLYLLVKGEKSGRWAFPSDVLVGRENLHQAAERIIVQSAGVNMNTWVVGRVPVGYHAIQPRIASKHSTTTTSSSDAVPGEKTFFIKARILAGQANLESNALGLTDFKWVTKQELEKTVSRQYFSAVKNMLADR